MNDDEKVEHHLQLSEDNDIDDNPCSPPHGVVPATTSVGRSTNQHMAATTRTSTSPEQQQGGAGEGDAVKENVGSDNPRPKRRRQGLLLLPNSFQAPALKKKKDKKR
ncbi:hypothetical protein MHU86_11218 [Fragilaria crotonensis]|nr:hypothetical protein MHU86_11218 [Fragilaria crotonensis]